MRRRTAARAAIAGAVLLVIVAATSGCGLGSGASPVGSVAAVGTVRVLPGTPEPVLPATARSADGRKVVVRSVDRVVPLTGAIAEIVFGLGLGAVVVGRDVSTTFAEAARLPVVTRAHDVSAEGVLSLRPTLVLADEDTGPPEVLDQIRAAGVAVVVVERPTELRGIANHVAAVAAAVGLTARGKALAAQALTDLDDVQRVRTRDGRAPVVAFLYVRGTAGVYLLGGRGSGADSMLDAVGAQDAGTMLRLDAFTPLTSEALVRARPDAILVMSAGLESVGGIDGLVALGGVAQTPAGRDRAVVALEDGELLSFGPRTGDTLRVLSSELAAVLR